MGTPKIKKSLAYNDNGISDDFDLDYRSSQQLVSFKYELYHIFDSAEKEVWLLMKDSLTRYQQTPTYEKMAIGKALRKRGGRRDSHRLSMGSNVNGRGVTNFWKELRSQLSI